MFVTLGQLTYYIQYSIIIVGGAELFTPGGAELFTPGGAESFTPGGAELFTPYYIYRLTYISDLLY